jgi:hypothetical protein
MKGIFYNSKESLCSIWESGKMCYDALSKSNKFTLDYSEEQTIDTSYDFAIFNQHYAVNNWMTREQTKEFGKPTFCIVTEISFKDSPIDGIPTFFHHYIVLDPTIKQTYTVHGFGRPIEDFDISTQPYIERNVPKIGSFGFATHGKDWHKIVECVQNELDEAEIHFNIPQGTYIPNSMQNELVNTIYSSCNKIIKKPGIKLRITHENWSKDELIKFCCQNTINCFFYNREHIFSAGLSAVTDQAIASGRPILVTKDRTFRHVHHYLDYFPNVSLKEAISNSQLSVIKMKHDWSSSNFLSKFENILF